MLRAGLYARVSSEEQAEGYSIDAQLDAMRAHVQGHGWEVAGEYVDPGFSGRNGDRPAFRRLLADAQAGAFCVVLVHKLDRFYRNLRGQLDALGQLEAWGIAFVSVVEAIDWSTPWGKLVQSQLGAFNQFYLDNLRQETRKGKRARAKAGRSNASTPPYGYRRTEDGQDVIYSPEAPAVVLAFETYVRGADSDQDVARLLNRSGFVPPGRARSGQWTREGIRYLLTNAFYAGMVRHGADLYPGQHKALIDLQMFHRVQAVRRRRRASRGGPRHPDRVYLLSGLARCHICGLRLVAQTCITTIRPYAYLRDVADRRGFDCAIAGASVRTAPLDAEAGELVSRLTLPPDWQARILELVGSDKQHLATERERARLEEKLRRLQRAYLEVEISEADYRREQAKAQACLDVLVIPEQLDLLEAGRFLETLGETWAVATPAERKELLGLLLAEVRVDVVGARVVCVEPRPVFVALFRQMQDLVERHGCFYLAESGDLC